MGGEDKGGGRRQWGGVERVGRRKETEGGSTVERGSKEMEEVVGGDEEKGQLEGTERGGNVRSWRERTEEVSWFGFY